jgi:hypothetical protein
MLQLLRFRRALFKAASIALSRSQKLNELNDLYDAQASLAGVTGCLPVA